MFDKTWKLFKGPSFGKNENDPLPDFSFKNINFTIKEGNKIDVWESTVPNPKGTVCLFHGLTSSKAYYLPEAKFFREHGYNVLLLDFRGHGKSEGMKTTIGYKEAEEVKLAYEYLKTKGERRIFLFGGSMGAVTITRAVSVYNLKPSGVILEMPFDSLFDHIKARGRSFGFPQTMFAIPVTSWIALENSFPAFKHKTSEYAKKIDCPVLLEWGTNDHLVMEKETTNIFNNLRSKNKKLVVYEEAVHSSFFRQDPVKWQKEIEQFLQIN
jgi:alpha-beta hydrolase superfamily lysophospholipase